MNEITLPDPDTHCLDEDFHPPKDVWSYSPGLVRQIIEADRARRGEPVAVMRITMERHERGQSLAPIKFFRFVRATPIEAATEGLPLGEYALYAAPQPERKHTEAEVQEIIGSALREWGVFEATVRDVLGVPKP